MSSLPTAHPEHRRPRRRQLRARLLHWRYSQFAFESRGARNLLPAVRQWHQRAGLFASLFMAWLGASGFVLNQSADWGLDAVRLDSSWLMSLYGLHPEPPETGFYAGPHWLAQTSENTIVNGVALSETVPSPLGLAVGGSESSPLLFIAAADRLVLVTPDGARIEELRGYVLPVSAIRRIGVLPDGQVAIQDLDIFVTRDGLDWREIPPGALVNWSRPEDLRPALQSLVLPFARPTMALEQVLIDAHSGRLFGWAGPWLINLVGVAAVFLGLSGAWVYWAAARRRRQRLA